MVRLATIAINSPSMSMGPEGAIEIPLPEPILYEAVLLAGARQAVAGELLAFLTSVRGREILRGYGFSGPSEQADDR